ncbi:S-layer homology domain-containing protein [Sporosarcina sp. E16_8]|uniref:S-layer homology domain-containing protein n=1 Tax=Sporosarcina sp. E16_8 TaxID=2789295 RepID=UPI001A921EBD|nr:S-layer homology domain-containing protein [Sporosarcina sp. E16_8]MBO0588906.1 S-layer homology domain-containing protein [Sporosarcina sp. E16_8]
MKFIDKKRILSIVLMMILLLAAVPSFASAASPFKDVKTDHPAYSSIEWAYKDGLIKGYPDGTFKPNGILTEAQFVALLIRFDCSAGDFSDNYRYMQSKNIPLNGYTKTQLRTQPITKGQVARIIAAFQGSDLSETYAVNYMYANNLATGATGKNDYQDYGANLSMTRADAADFFKRLSKYGDCSMIGLNRGSNGGGDKQDVVPPNFTGKETVFFPKPEKDPNPPVSKPSNSQLTEFTVEKGSLIANGVDSTFVTLSLKTCSGDPISYEDSLSFSVTSKVGAKITQDDRRFDEKGNEIGSALQTNYNSSFVSDGPDLTVKVTAPASKNFRTDEISFQINDRNNKNKDLNCYTKPVSVQLDYTPQAELRIEIVGNNNNNTNGYGLFNGTLPADGSSARITATIVRPGGEVIRGYNGRVRFRSAEGAYLSDQYAYFSNGVATIYMSSIWSSQPILDEITAEIVQSDPRYQDDIASILNKTHGREVAYDPPLRSAYSCSTNAEVAFIIDSSGSMQQSDPGLLRITKTKEFLAAINPTRSLASRFNSTGHLLSPSRPANDVRPSIDNVGQSGGTNIAAGLDVAFKNYSGNGPKVAILLTDGKSNENKVLEMLKYASAQGITIHTIGLGNAKQLNEPLLKKLAHETGGQYYHVAESIDLGIAYQSILSEVTCGIPAPTCTTASHLFRSPTLERTSSSFFMSTYINERCSVPARVILRFNSLQGDIDYELIPRGQGLYALTKEINEIANFDLYSEGVFIAFGKDRYGNEYELGKRYVQMK